MKKTARKVFTYIAGLTFLAVGSALVVRTFMIMDFYYLGVGISLCILSPIIWDDIV